MTTQTYCTRIKEKPNKIILALPVERKKSKFVDWNEKEMYEYTIQIPSWVAFDFLKKGFPIVVCEFSKDCLKDKFGKENREEWKDYFSKKWSKRLTKMRKLNNGYMKVMTKGLAPSFFETHEGYKKYHEELKKLNEKYLKHE